MSADPPAAATLAPRAQLYLSGSYDMTATEHTHTPTLSEALYSEEEELVKVCRATLKRVCTV